MTPLLLACSSGALDTVERLLELGASPALLTRSQRGVIHLAALNRHVKVSVVIYLAVKYSDFKVDSGEIKLQGAESRLKRSLVYLVLYPILTQSKFSCTNDPMNQ